MYHSSLDGFRSICNYEPNDGVLSQNPFTWTQNQIVGPYCILRTHSAVANGYDIISHDLYCCVEGANRPAERTSECTHIDTETPEMSCPQVPRAIACIRHRKRSRVCVPHLLHTSICSQGASLLANLVWLQGQVSGKSLPATSGAP